MKISKEFQGFFFGVVIPELKKAQQPMRYQNPFTQEWYLINLNKVSDKGVYQFMKLINPHYPKLQDLLPASTTVLTNKHMTQHIQWIERLMAMNGHTAQYISEEWDRLLADAEIKKDK